jgi:Holliday junction resolvase
MKFAEKIKMFLWIWFLVLILNQIFIFRGCFAPYCLLAALPHTGLIAYFIVFYLGKDVKLEKTNPNVETPTYKPKEKTYQQQPPPKDGPLKSKGDQYERHIGKRFEEKGDLVIYNGFIKGYEDGGVDVVAISTNTKTINLIQCKNWTQMVLEINHIKQIYQKLQKHDLDFLPLPINEIKKHLHVKKDDASIQKIISDVRGNLKDYTLRKTLYIASDKVVNLEVGKHLTMIKPNIFRYEDMKIVVETI